MTRTTPLGRCAVVLAASVLVGATCVVPALAAAPPSISHISVHRGPYWGGSRITISGLHFGAARTVLFGSVAATSVHANSLSRLTVVTPYHRSYGRVIIRVVTASGVSKPTPDTTFTFRAPRRADHIQGGMTLREEQHRSHFVRARHQNAHITRQRARHWTAAMGRSSVRRAASWIGLPYSWAGGNGGGPTGGVCAHNGGDFDCHVIGFDCSGLTLYAWWPYLHLVHHAATQHRTAGRFHPTITELVPGDLVFFSGDRPEGIGHTAVYAGDGMVIQSPQSGQSVTRSLLADVIAGHSSYHGATRPMSVGRQGPRPVVTSVTARRTTAGTRIEIGGRALAGTTALRLLGQTYYRFSRTTRRLVITLAVHRSRPFRVAVSNAWGTVTRRVVPAN